MLGLQAGTLLLAHFKHNSATGCEAQWQHTYLEYRRPGPLPQRYVFTWQLSALPQVAGHEPLPTGSSAALRRIWPESPQVARGSPSPRGGHLVHSDFCLIPGSPVTSLSELRSQTVIALPARGLCWGEAALHSAVQPTDVC